MRKMAALFFVLIVSGCGGEGAETPQAEPLRGFDEVVVDATAPPVVAFESDSESSPARVASEGISADGEDFGLAILAPSRRCGVGGDFAVGTLTAPGFPNLTVVSPDGLLESGALLSLEDSRASGGAVVVCLTELEDVSFRSSCGVVPVGDDLVSMQQTPRQVQVAWHSEEPGEEPYISPPALLFEECPSIDASDPLLHGDSADLEVITTTGLISAETLADALLPSLTAFVKLDGEAPTPAQCRAITLTAERTLPAIAALHSAWGPEGTPYPDTIQYSPQAVDDARTQIDEFLDANAAAIRELEGEGLQLLYEGVQLNGIVWNRLLDNIAQDLETNGDAWFRWKLGRQSGVGHALGDPAHSMQVMVDVANGLCAEGTPGVEGPAGSEAVCNALVEVYEHRFNARSNARSGFTTTNNLIQIHEQSIEIEALYPAGSNPFFPDESIGAMIDSEWEFEAILTGRSSGRLDMLEWAELIAQLDAFAQTCPSIDSEHLALPSVLDELQLTEGDLRAAEDAIIAAEEAERVQYSAFDEETFIAAIERVRAPDGWLINSNRARSRLDAVLEAGSVAALSLNVTPLDPGLFFTTEGLEAGKEVAHTALTEAGFLQVEIVCDSNEVFEYLYESPNGATGSVVVSGSITSAPPAVLEFELPGQEPGERGFLCA